MQEKIIAGAIDRAKIVITDELTVRNSGPNIYAEKISNY